jgi:hypothetical protein
MAPPSTEKVRVGFVLHQPHPGIVMQLHGPAPVDPFDPHGLWGDLDGAGLPPDTQLRIDYTRTADGPRDVVAVVLTADLCARLPLVVTEPGAVEVEAVELRRRDGQPLGARALSGMGLGTVHKVLGRVLSSPIAHAHLGEPWSLRAPQSGRAEGSADLDYALEARAYVAALQAEPRRPIRHMIEQGTAYGSTGSADVIRARLKRARKRGLLTEASDPGHPGGELTDLAIQLLNDAGV